MRIHSLFSIASLAMFLAVGCTHHDQPKPLAPISSPPAREVSSSHDEQAPNPDVAPVPPKPAAIDVLARKMGLEAPHPGQVVQMDGTGPEGSRPVMASMGPVSVIAVP